MGRDGGIAFQGCGAPVERGVGETAPRAAEHLGNHSPERSRAARRGRESCASHRRCRREPVRPLSMDPRLSYNFDEIESSVRQEIHTASARLNVALQELKANVAPLQEIGTREAPEDSARSRCEGETGGTAQFTSENAMRSTAWFGRRRLWWCRGQITTRPAESATQIKHIRAQADDLERESPERVREYA